MEKGPHRGVEEISQVVDQNLLVGVVGSYLSSDFASIYDLHQ